MRFVHHRSVIGGSKEIAVSVLGYPVGASEMRFVDLHSSFGMFVGIKAKDDADDFRPMRGIGLCIKQSKIGLKMRTVVFGQVFAVWRLVQKVSLAHLFPILLARGLGAYG